MKNFEAMTPEEIAEFNEQNSKKNDVDFKNFKQDLSNDLCWVCKEPLASFNEDKPCQHWLLKPEGFRKKHFKVLFNSKTIDQIEGYLRWYVNAFEPIKNINDLKEEHGEEKIKAITIKHEQLEWSFSCTKGCFDGSHGPHGPHYHFQMRVNDRPFHDYSDRHIKLSPYEVWLMNIELGKHPKIKRLERHGAGMHDLLDFADPEALLNSMESTDDMDNATFHISSLVMAKDENGISGDDLAALIEEHNATGVPMHRLLSKLDNADTQIIIEPGEGVPKAAPRTKRKRGRGRK
jgi:hypothetical protein